MGLFFEKASSQSRNYKWLVNVFIVVIIVDIVNNFILQWSWFSVVSVILYIVFITLFVREMLKGNNNWSR